MYHIVSSLLTPGWTIYFLGFSGSPFTQQYLTKEVRLEEKG